MTTCSLWGNFLKVTVKASITLSEGLIKTIDGYKDRHKDRSEFIEDAVRAFVREMIRRQKDVQDLETMNPYASSLNREAADVLAYQVEL